MGTTALSPPHSHLGDQEREAEPQGKTQSGNQEEKQGSAGPDTEKCAEERGS